MCVIDSLDLPTDRLCCMFERWELGVEPNKGPLWLRITATAGTKDLARSVLETTNLISESVLEAAGLRPLERRAPEQSVSTELASAATPAG